MVLPEKSTPRELKPLSFIDNTNSMMFQAPILMLYKHKSSMTGTDPALEVRRHAPVLVTPAKPTPRELKQLSDIDCQKALRFQAPVMLLYKNNPYLTGKDPAEVLRKAMAEVLVPYYPFAGKLVKGANQKLFVDCNSEGIPFIEADTSAKVEDIIGMIESGREPFFEELLPDVPGSSGILGCPLWLFQVTRFKCGGFSLGAYFNHTITDGTGLAQFLCAIAEYVRGETVLSTPPVWQRECILAREPPRITCQHLEFEQIENVSPQTTVECQKSMIFKSFYFGQEKITALKNYLHIQSGETYTSYEIVTACLWRCRTRALKTDPEQIVEFSCVANGRYIKELEVPHGYYGNVFVCPSVFSKSETLCTNPLEYATDLVRKSKEKLSGEYVRSTIDHIVSKEGEYWTEWKYVASDNRRLGLYEADFGWGKPLIGGAVKGNFLLTFYMGYKEGVLAPMCLPETVMARFELEFNNLMNSVS